MPAHVDRPSRLGRPFLLAAVALALAAATGPAPSWATTGAPEIRLSPLNSVPTCVTPERLMAFLASRNPALDRRYADLARYYKRHGEAWRVRWDYAFFQMALETNFLTYRRGDGRWGDVDPRQNNFAGIGTTGGGVPGDNFPDIGTGVLAQIQHLVAYSGERLAAPVAPRTRLKQDDIVEVSQKLARPVRFSDLARRWAVDPKYGHSIEWVAESFRRAYCNGREEVAAGWSATTRQVARAAPPMALGLRVPEPRPATRRNVGPATATPPAVAGAPAPPQGANSPCFVDTASYGGDTTTLIRSESGGTVRYTALSVLDGFEASMTENFIRTRVPGGERIATFLSKDAAVAHARTLCSEP